MRRFLLAFLLFTSPAFAQAPTLFGTPTTFVDTVSESSFTVAYVDASGTLSANTVFLLTCAAEGAATPAFSTPSGWTVVENQPSPNGQSEADVFFKTIANGGSVPASVICALASGGYPASGAGGMMLAYQNINFTTPVDVKTSANSNTAGATIVGPAVTTTKANDMVVWVFFTQGDVGASAVSWSQGTAEAQLTRSAMGANGYGSMVQASFASTGSTGTNTQTAANSTTQKMMVTVAIAAPASAASPGFATVY